MSTYFRLLSSAILFVVNVRFLAARDMKIDVVLIDTAGRMQDNEPLMRALSKVSCLNKLVYQSALSKSEWSKILMYENCLLV